MQLNIPEQTSINEHISSVVVAEVVVVDGYTDVMLGELM